MKEKNSNPHNNYVRYKHIKKPPTSTAEVITYEQLEDIVHSFGKLNMYVVNDKHYYIQFEYPTNNIKHYIIIRKKNENTKEK